MCETSGTPQPSVWEWHHQVCQPQEYHQVYEYCNQVCYSWSFQQKQKKREAWINCNGKGLTTYQQKKAIFLALPMVFWAVPGVTLSRARSQHWAQTGVAPKEKVVQGRWLEKRRNKIDKKVTLSKQGNGYLEVYYILFSQPYLFYFYTGRVFRVWRVIFARWGCDGLQVVPYVVSRIVNSKFVLNFVELFNGKFSQELSIRDYTVRNVA